MVTTVLEGELLQVLNEAEKCIHRALEIVDNNTEETLTHNELAQLKSILVECRDEVLFGIAQTR